MEFLSWLEESPWLALWLNFFALCCYWGIHDFSGRDFEDTLDILRELENDPWSERWERMGLIDSERLKETMKPHVDSMKIKSDMTWEEIWQEECGFIDRAPIVDAVPVVRCKDCKYNQESACEYSAVWVRPNGFCQWGERREYEAD